MAGAGLLLDTYTHVEAFTLDNLKAVQGDVITARRADNVESGFTATEIADGTLSTWAGGTGVWVKEWIGVNGTIASQTTAAYQPQIASLGVVYTLGGKPTMVFSGGQFLRCAAAVITTNAWAIDTVLQVDSIASKQAIYAQRDGTAAVNRWWTYIDNAALVS